MPAACNVTGNPINGLQHTNNWQSTVPFKKDSLDTIILQLKLCRPVVFGVTFNPDTPDKVDHTVIVYGYSNVIKNPDGSIVDADLSVWDPGEGFGAKTIKYSVFPATLENNNNVRCDFTAYTKPAS
jgi:hypothetical protein